MENYYRLLGVNESSSPREIKKAFRERAKQLHPDIAGNAATAEMRRLLTAYEVLSKPDQRHEYDRAFNRILKKGDFNYRTFLQEHDDPASQAKLVFFDLMHLEEERALEIWRRQGGLGFPLQKYLDQEDWMDCTFLLAEELEKRQCYYEAFMLLVDIVREERRRPYFRHFIIEVEAVLKELVRLRLKSSLDEKTYILCMENLLDLGFPSRDEARWLRSMAESLVKLGELKSAGCVFREALRRDPHLPNTVRLKRKLQIRDTENKV
ncbi:MAG: J domain-containing protein [Treponema sp.]|nr:J domain-containing protein [Treponema sp.]